MLFVVIHYMLTPWAQRYWHESDPKHYILDEISGYLLVPVLAIGTDRIDFVLLGFAIERACDIVKLPGARYFDRKVHDATGVLMDDIVSGLYAAAILSCILLFSPHP